MRGKTIGGENLDGEGFGDRLTFGECVGGSAGIVEEVGDRGGGDVERGGAVGAGSRVGEAKVSGDPAVGGEPCYVDGDGAVDTREGEGSGGGVDAEDERAGFDEAV